MKKKLMLFAVAVVAVCGSVAYSFSAMATGPDQGNGKCLLPPGGSCFYSTESTCPCH